MNLTSNDYESSTLLNVTDDDCGMEEVHEVFNLDDEMEPLPIIPKRRKLLNVRLRINSIPTNCCLDTGATVDCMSQNTAISLGIKPYPDRRTIPIRNVHQKVEQALLSQKVKVSLNESDFVFVNFAILEQECRTLLALPTMQQLKMHIITHNNEISVNGTNYECFQSEFLTHEPEQPNNTLIQQTRFGDLDSVIHTESLRWDAQLSPTQNDQAEDLLKEYADVWYAPKVGKCTTVQMEILVHGRPKRVTARPTPPHLRKELNRQIDELLESNVIKPAPDCPWVSRCHLVPKPRSDKWRLVIDYRYVNTLMQDDSYQIPNVQDLITRLSGSKYFSLIDLNWGFWNVSLTEEAQQYTGFVVPERGVFIWTVLPFGLKTGPSVFQRAIEKALRPLIDGGKVSVYIDDIIIFTDTIEEHIDLLQQVLQLLRVSGFFVNLPKARLFRKEVLYLGHIIQPTSAKA